MEDISRIGTVNGIDRENGMISVLYEDRNGKVTQQLPFLSFNDEYKMPKIGDKVLVLHLSNGTEMAVVLGKYWNKANKPVDLNDTYRKQFDYDGKSFIKYEEKTGELLIQAPRIKLIASEKQMNIESNLYITEDAIAGTISLQKHTHMGAHGETSKPH